MEPEDVDVVLPPVAPSSSELAVTLPDELLDDEDEEEDEEDEEDDEDDDDELDEDELLEEELEELLEEEELLELEELEALEAAASRVFGSRIITSSHPLSLPPRSTAATKSSFSSKGALGASFVLIRSFAI